MSLSNTEFIYLVRRWMQISIWKEYRLYDTFWKNLCAKEFDDKNGSIYSYLFSEILIKIPSSTISSRDTLAEEDHGLELDYMSVLESEYYIKLDMGIFLHPTFQVPCPYFRGVRATGEALSDIHVLHLLSSLSLSLSSLSL